MPGHARGRQLRCHAPAADAGPAGARDLDEVGVEGGHLLDQRGRGVEARVGGQQPFGVGQQHEVRGPDQVRHQRGQPIVVTEADLLVGDGVVLVDDRHDVKAPQRLEGPSRVEVLAAV
jgi:hypothetical protein